jgi:hypothetical protein
MAIKERLEEERGYLKQVIPKPPGAELRGIRIVKEFKRSGEETQRKAYETGKLVAEYFENLGGKKLIQENNPKSELGRILFGGVMKKELFENAKIQYAYDKENKIYSMVVWLDKQPRILTFRVGKNLVEASLADLNGNVLEVLSHENGQLKYMGKKK